MNEMGLFYYGLDSKSNAPIDAERVWLGNNRPAHFCPGCASAYPKASPLEAVVLDTRGGSKRLRLPLEFVPAVYYEIIRDDLMAILEPEAHSELNIGVLLDENGNRIPNYQTAQAKTAVLLRGGPESKNNGICDKCGWRRYYPMPHGYGYLLRTTFPEGTPILRTGMGLAVNQAIRDRILAAGLGRGMYIVRRPVQDAPEDGLPTDMKYYEKVENQVAKPSP